MIKQLHSIFRQTVFDYFHNNGRDFPWRHTSDPYEIWVSEIMLQQTQTERVIPKYEAFIAAFPTIQSLALADEFEVLRLWQGLGYNRRGLALHRGAKQVMSLFNGEVPKTEVELLTLPGIGAYTAGAICAFAYNKPVVIIETNIRRVFIYHYFSTCHEVHDKELMPLISETVDLENPREWYYALMDYGASMAKKMPNPNRKSKHYIRQVKFEGSNRQVRGAIIKYSLENPKLTFQSLVESTQFSPDRIHIALEGLIKEDFPLPKSLTLSHE